jgi:3-phenylpropionate/trans-cinnamate dioxygenase ferredoxin subunit
MPQWVNVSKLSDLPEGSVRIVQIHGQRIALCRLAGSCYAIADLCTHDNGPLGEGMLVGEEIECPRHGARFNVKTGEPVTLPAVLPVQTFPVKVEGEEVWVGL